MSGYLSAHPFEPHRESDSYCGFPDPDFNGDCVKSPDHPIHAVDRTDIEDLARALSAHPWRTTPDALVPNSEHRRHGYSYECALCKQDVHAIAAFVIDYLRATP